MVSTAAKEERTLTPVTSDPHPPILFFDGGCALCHGAVRRLLKWERPGQGGLKFAPLDGPTAHAMRNRQALPQHLEAVILWTTEGTFEGEAAVGTALDVIGRTGAARLFRFFPPLLRHAGYRIIARNRHRWFGRMPAGCPMPADASRMLP